MDGEFFVIKLDGMLPPAVVSTKEEADSYIQIAGESNKPEIVHVIEISNFIKLHDRFKKYENALNKIGMLSMSGIAYTKEFTDKVESITREVLGVEKRWPY